jgi:hypothetical protein
MPTMPALSAFAAISPATNVPWPTRSRHALPPTKLRIAAIRFANSGCVQSIPESTIPTFTGESVVGGSCHASNAWSCARYHCLGTSGSVGVYAAAGAARARAASAASASRLTAR